MREVTLHSNDFAWEELARECATLEDETEPLEAPAAAAVDFGTLARDNWELFHRRNDGRAYKPRNYLIKEFPELDNPAATSVRVLELGCGYGSAIFPILAACPNVTAEVCDLSPRAIELLRANPEYDPRRVRAFVCDVTREDLGVAPDSFDVVLMVFALSAVPPSAFAATLARAARALRRGGVLCFRDYGRYDLAMRRNAKRLGPGLYHRSDGTLAYFFSREDMEALVGRTAGLGLEIVENDYATVRLVNRKKGTTMDRVWLHVKCRKTSTVAEDDRNDADDEGRPSRQEQ